MIDSEIERRARLYASQHNLATDSEPFDGGDDGAVWHTDRQSVLKVFHREDNYHHELECYKRLRDAGIGKRLREFNVPELLGHSDELWVIEMGLVTPPYILDFGKAYLHDPRWDRHIIDDWNQKMQFWWGDDVKRVRLALLTLRQYGIWYYDAKPGNVMLENWNPSLDS